MSLFRIKYIWLLCFLVCAQFAPIVTGQTTVKIYGSVSDAQSGIPLYQANVVVERTGLGVSTNQQGEYRIENMLEGFYTLTASYIGYEEQTLSDVRVSKDQAVYLRFQLKPEPIRLDSVQVFALSEYNNSPTQPFIITRREIRQTNALSLGDVLDKVPGVEISQTGSVGSSQKVSIRGSQTNQVLVLLDDVPLNDEMSGSVDLSNIPLNIIESIEIYKGGQSAQFGSGAIGGVVRIKTQNRFTNQLQVSSRVGSFQLMSIEPTLSGQYKNWNYLIACSHAETEGNFPYQYTDSNQNVIEENRINADFLSRNLFAKLNFNWRNHQLSVQGQRLKSERGLPGKIDAWTAYARTNYAQEMLGAEYQTSIRNLRVTANWRYSDALTENSNLYPDDADKRYRRYYKWNYQYEVRNSLFQTNLDYAISPWLCMKTGYTGRLLRYEDENLLTASSANQAKDVSHGFFLHQEWRVPLPKLLSQLVMTPAVRYDEMTFTNETDRRVEHQWSPAFGVIWSTGITHQVFVKSSLSKSFRAPTFADLFYQDARVEGKPDLASEKSTNVEFGGGFRFKVAGQITAETDIFRYTVDDLIVWKLGSFEVFRPFNTDALIRGQEYRLGWNAPNHLIALNLGYTRLEPLNKSDNTTTHDKILPYKPQDSFKGGIEVNWRGWFASVACRSVGKQYINEANTKAISAYRIWDLNGSWTFTCYGVQFDLKGSVLNLFGETYEIIKDMPMPQREWRLAFNFKL